MSGPAPRAGRRGVPSRWRSNGALNFASAYKSETRVSCDGKKSIHVRHIRLAGDKNPNTKELDSWTI